MDLYSAHIHTLQARFDKAMDNYGYDSVLIYSGHQVYPFMDDNSLTFRVNPYFKYWLPLVQQQRSYILLRPGSKPHLFLYQIEDYWHAQPSIPEGQWQSHFNLTVIGGIDELKSVFSGAMANCAFIGENNGADPDWKMADNPTDLMAYLNYHRAYKTDYEIDCMRQANRIAAKAHAAAEHAFMAGKSELEVHQAYLASINYRESELPYNNIIAFNQGASILHYDQYQTTVPETRRSFLIDAGAAYQGYNADISRTYVAEGEEHNEFRALFDAYCQEYFALLNSIEENKSYLNFHDDAHRRIARLLSEFDIVKTSPEETYNKGYSQLFFPCGVGHYIGLQVHDIGGYLANEQGDECKRDSRYPFLRLMRPIERDTVFTVEPGIYFIEQLLRGEKHNADFNWSRIDQLSPYGGFRLEDDIAMTEGGPENLSTQAFEWLKAQ